MNHCVKITVNDKPYMVEVADHTTTPLTVMVNGRSYTVTVETVNADAVPSAVPTTAAVHPQTASPLVRKPSGGMGSISAGRDLTAKRIKSPMPGSILDINVKPGDKVSFGQQLCALEAMKMKCDIRSPRDGVIASVEVREGQAVDYGGILFTLE
jgi:biotin carboxyl carrier protein